MQRSVVDSVQIAPEHRPQTDLSGTIRLPEQRLLPPGVNLGKVHGQLEITVGDLNWLNYENMNYLTERRKGRLLMDEVYANIMFWGEPNLNEKKFPEDLGGRGIYLAFKNNTLGRQNTFKYDIVVPEQSFEQYLDDMGPLQIDLYEATTSYTIGVGRIQPSMFLKRKNKQKDSLLDFGTICSISLIGDQAVRIGEFEINLRANFKNYNQMNRQQIDLNEETVDAYQMAENRVAKSLLPQAQQRDYQGGYQNAPIQNSFQEERPVRDTSKTLTNSKIQDNARKQITIDENEESRDDFAKILQRGERLRAQMEQAIEPSSQAWEAIHGASTIPKTYVPPFMQDDFSRFVDKNQRVPDFNEIEELLHYRAPEQDAQKPLNVETSGMKNHMMPSGEGSVKAREILDMKYIYLKIHKVNVFDHDLIQIVNTHAWHLQVDLPLPQTDVVAEQTITMRNFTQLSNQLYDFNSTASFFFKLTERTLAPLAESAMTGRMVIQPTNDELLHRNLEMPKIEGKLNMNKVLLASNFQVDASLDLFMTINKDEVKHVATLNLMMNLQADDQEDEARRNFELRMAQIEEEAQQAELDRKDLQKKRLKFNMEAASVFGQIYVHIQGLGKAENLETRDDHSSSLNNRATGDNDEVIIKQSNEEQPSDELARAVDTHEAMPVQDNQQSVVFQKQSIVFPKRNLFVKFKAFPNLENMKTKTMQQVDEESSFSFRSQFPVLMTAENLQKMESYTFVFELWDQVSPEQDQFIGYLKVPLAPIAHAMQTTDQEIYSLNFLADQYCLYPLIFCDGYQKIYSPSKDQSVCQLKVTVAMGSAVQVTRLIEKENEEIERRAKEVARITMIEVERKKELEIMEAKRKRKEEKQRKEEEERKRKEQEEEDQNALSGILGGGLGGSPGKKVPKNLEKLLRQSLGSQNPDYDQREHSMLNALRKLFEEARSQNITELNGQPLFQDEMKNFDGSVNKDDVVYAFLNSELLSLTRSEVGSIIQLLSDINRRDDGRIDVDELHFSFQSYLKYYEIIEQRVLDLLEKFKITASKSIKSEEELMNLISDLESKAENSKVAMIDMQQTMDKHGVAVRDALYDQFAQFFDLDRDQQVYITSLVEFLKNPTSEKINYFKVSKEVISSQITNYVKNAVDSTNDCLFILEEEFKQEIHSQNQRAIVAKKREMQSDDSSLPGEDDEDEVLVIPPELLMTEKINAKLFQYKLKRLGIALSLWEIFTLFEQLNMNARTKMYFEPQRYHQVMFGNFYQFINNKVYERNPKGKFERRQQPKELDMFDQQKLHSPSPPPKTRDYQQDLRKSYQEEEVIDRFDNDDDDPRKPYEQIKHVFQIKVKELKNMPVLNKFLAQIENQHDNVAPSQYVSEDVRKKQYLLANKYIQNIAVKYSFPLDEDEILESDYLQLNQEALDTGFYNYNVSMDTVHNYIVNKRESISRVLELCQQRGAAQAVNERSDQRREELFNISICLYQDNREYIVGNAHLPIEDLLAQIQQHETKSGAYQAKEKKTYLKRTLFIYGTTYSQRENCIIGKLELDVQYSREKQYLTKHESRALKLQKDQMKEGQNEPGTLNNPFSCFMHRETYVNRKIPLNAKLAILIERVSNLKESIENIEHFAKIQHTVNGVAAQQTSLTPGFQDELAISSMVRNKQEMEHLDRRRVMKHILKNGLNLLIRCSVFEEDKELMNKFQVESQTQKYAMAERAQPFDDNLSKYQTRMLYNSLNPVFGELFEMSLQMNTKIFEYLKNKRAVFEIRHYIVESQKQKTRKMRQSYANTVNDRVELGDDTMIEDEDVVGNCDYIVLGYVKVPLLQLITKNNGIDGDFNIFDEFNQNMGSLRLRVTLNHHNAQRPLYSMTQKTASQQPNKGMLGQTVIDRSLSITNAVRTNTLTQDMMAKQNLILGLDFIELIIKKRAHLTEHQPGLIQRFFLKYRIMNQNFQTKFLSGETGNQLSALNIMLKNMNLQRLAIQKSNFIELDLTDVGKIEEAFGKPLEIQLWYKVESQRSYERPIKEEMLGQFFVEINDLTKYVNRRLKSPNEQAAKQPGKFEVFEGYFSLHDSKKDILSPDRLGMRLYLFQKDHTSEMLTVDDMTGIFNHHRPKIEELIRQKLDPEGLGYVDCEDLVAVCKQVISNQYLQQKLLWFIKSSLQFKSVDHVYYSPLFGLPPPFFKYANKFDQLDIICKINEQLEELDAAEHGFIQVNHFRNTLENELNIKPKIIEDFINGIRDNNLENSNIQSVTATVKETQSIDVNLITNSLKTSHVDYIVLVRKLAQFTDQRQMAKETHKLVSQTIMEQQEERNDAEQVKMFFEVDNAMRLRHPHSQNSYPNAYVSMKPNILQYKESKEDQYLLTNEIKSNSYPVWNFRSNTFTVPLNNQNIQSLDQGSLEFEVFHNDGDSAHLIGVAFVPMNQLMEGKTRVTGLFDVIGKAGVYSSQQGIVVGKLKVAIQVDKSIKKVLQGDYQSVQQSRDFDVVRQSVNSTQQDVARKAFSFGKVMDSQALRDSAAFSVASVAQRSAVDEIEDYSKDFEKNLQQKSDEELEHLHKLKMSQLDDLTNSLKQSMANLPYYENGVEISPETNTRKLGMTTMKTDANKSMLEEQLQKFRQENQQESQQLNPFSSKNFDKIDEESEQLDQREKVEESPLFQEDEGEVNLDEFNMDQLKRYEQIGGFGQNDDEL